MTYSCNDKALKARRRFLRRSQTDAEQRLWQILRNKQVGGLKFFRQYSAGTYILDFYCPGARLAIEVDGGQHLENSRDIKRADDLRRVKISILRFWNSDVLTNPGGVYEKIMSTITSPLKMRGD